MQWKYMKCGAWKNDAFKYLFIEFQRHAEDHLKTINNQFLTLPCIEEPEKKPVPAKLVKWYKMFKKGQLDYVKSHYL